MLTMFNNHAAFAKNLFRTKDVSSAQKLLILLNKFYFLVFRRKKNFNFVAL